MDLSTGTQCSKLMLAHVVLVQALITPITAATITVLEQSWSPGRRKQRRARRGFWYVRNAAKANRKPCTLVSNEINASSFSGAKGQIRESGSIDT